MSSLRNIFVGEEIPGERDLETYAALVRMSRGRVHDEPSHPFRPLYQRDRDRIIHCAAFRRLEYKTQVFVNHVGDHYRTRLTHTLEVSQISRTIARALGLNEDLTEAIALAHDLGHTPFGHAGEAMLDKLMAGQGGFEHNRQGLRVADILERRYHDFPGLNLSYEVREAFVKHSSREDKPAVPEEFHPEESATLETQVTVVADEIAYDNHDIDDGLASGILCENELAELELWRMAIQRVGSDYENLDAGMRRAEAVRALINILVTDTIQNSIRNIGLNAITNIDDVRQTRDSIVCLSPDMKKHKAEVEEYLSQKFYSHESVVAKTTLAQQQLEKIFDAYTGDLTLIPEDYRKRFGGEDEHRLVCDYISGMTDRFAEHEFSKLS